MFAPIRARVLTAAAAALLVSGGGAAFAEEAAPAVGGSVGYFGEHGQVAVAVDFKFDIVYNRFSSVPGSPGRSRTDYLIQPSLDYFASTNVSLGGALTLQNQEYGLVGDLSTIGLGLRAGYNVVLTGPLSLWIRGGFGYNHRTFGGVAGANGTGFSIPFTVYAAVLWHPVSHFFVGLGPVFQTELVSKFTFEGDADSLDAPKLTQFGLQSTIGGYFGGL
ncbi:MAG: hypothetical protein ABUL77_04595 [Bacteroidota bacterium]